MKAILNPVTAMKCEKGLEQYNQLIDWDLSAGVLRFK